MNPTNKYLSRPTIALVNAIEPAFEAYPVCRDILGDLVTEPGEKLIDEILKVATKEAGFITRVELVFAGVLQTLLFLSTNLDNDEKPTGRSTPTQQNETLKAAVAQALQPLTATIDGLVTKVQGLVEKPQVSKPVEVKIASAVQEKLAATAAAVETMASRLSAQEEARKLASAERATAIAERKAAHAKKMAEQAEIKAKKQKERREAQAAAKAARAQREARKREIVSKKKQGLNPYSEDETKAFIAKLASKGKPYYTPEQRAAFKAQKKSAKVKRPKAARPAFVPYTDEQKAAYKAALEAKGKVYYTKEQRAAHKAKLASQAPSQ